MADGIKHTANCTSFWKLGRLTDSYRNPPINYIGGEQVQLRNAHLRRQFENARSSPWPHVRPTRTLLLDPVSSATSKKHECTRLDTVLPSQLRVANLVLLFLLLEYVEVVNEHYGQTRVDGAGLVHERIA